MDIDCLSRPATIFIQTSLDNYCLARSSRRENNQIINKKVETVPKHPRYSKASLSIQLFLKVNMNTEECLIKAPVILLGFKDRD
jgi:hypothetical protein